MKAVHIIMKVVGALVAVICLLGFFGGVGTMVQGDTDFDVVMLTAMLFVGVVCGVVLFLHERIGNAVASKGASNATPNAARAQKQSKYPSGMLFFSLYGLVLGVVLFSTLAILAVVNPDAIAAPIAVLVMMAIAVLLVILGIRGVLSYRNQKRMNPSMKLHPLAIFFIALLGIGTVVSIPSALFGTFEEANLGRALDPYVQESFSDEGIPMPDDPHFVFYDADTHSFSVPNRNTFPQGTNDPDEVNVVVVYDVGLTAIGEWVTADTGEYVKDAEAQYATIQIVRLEDWALISETTVYEDKDFDEGQGTYSLEGMHEAVRYINSAME
ncbi:hypothetical protein [Slackia heliotrinireducens]|uniref:hypothetical protein n=1 Tax=Slackia heliotrinireducens TaxID=84110 RepID=UPI003315E63B